MFEQVAKTLNFLNKTLDLDAKVVRQKSDFIPIYLLASYLLRRYAVSAKETDFHDFVLKFLTITSNIDLESSKVSDEDRPYFDYRLARSKSTESRRSIESGFRVILTQFLKENPNTPLKDQQRTFDYGQKLAVYTRVGGRCEKHEGKVNFDEAEFHHVKYYSNGGPTTVENARLLCKKCHDEVHGGSEE